MGGRARASRPPGPASAARGASGSQAGAAARAQGRQAREADDREPFDVVARDTYVATASADFTANIVRNVWSHAIIFCGHFPDQTYTFSQEETEDETRGGRYVRQLIGAANIEGGPLFHVISGNLGYQVEHHLYPDMPSTRYGEIAPRVREICKRYDLPYNTGPFASSGHGAPHDRPAGVPRRQGRARSPGPTAARRDRLRASGGPRRRPRRAEPRCAARRRGPRSRLNAPGRAGELRLGGEAVGPGRELLGRERCARETQLGPRAGPGRVCRPRRELVGRERCARETQLGPRAPGRVW